MPNDQAIEALIALHTHQAVDNLSRGFALVEQRQRREGETEQPGAGSKRIEAWISSVRRLDTFVSETGRLPRMNGRLPRGSIPGVERALAEWQVFQRRTATRERHCAYQATRLSLVKGFSWDPLGDQWDAMHAEYVAYLAVERRAPRFRSPDPREKRLAAWAAKQRHSAKNGTVTPERRARLRMLGVHEPRQ